MIPAPPPKDGPILLAGCVVDDLGQPVPEVKIGVHVRGQGVKAGPYRGRADEAGRFTIHGTSPPGAQLLVDLLCAGYRGNGFLREVPGRTDAVLVMNREAVIRGWIRAEPDAPLDHVYVEAEREHSDDRGSWSSHVQEDASFRISRLRPGRYTVRGRLRMYEDPLFEVEGIQVAVGEVVDDPRLEAITLSSPLHLFEVKAESPEGRLLRDATARLPDVPLYDVVSARIRADRAGVLRIASLDPAPRVEIGVDGRRSTRVLLTSPKTTVVLGSPLRVVLVVPGIAGLPRDRVRISVGLHEPGSAGVKPCRDLNESGELRLDLPTPGPREVCFLLATWKDGSSRYSRYVPVADPEVVEVLDTDSEQRFVLDLPPEVIEAASRR